MDGCRRSEAYHGIGVSSRTLERWRKNNNGDQRKGPTAAPSNKLTLEEVKKIIAISTSAEYQNLSVTQIVPKLVDNGEYIASESSFYRVLKSQDLSAHRAASRPKINHRPDPHIAESPNEVWSWDITYLQSMIRGIFFYLYLVMDSTVEKS